jgi:hypothetical protein
MVHFPVSCKAMLARAVDLAANTGSDHVGKRPPEIGTRQEILAN